MPATSVSNLEGERPPFVDLSSRNKRVEIPAGSQEGLSCGCAGTGRNLVVCIDGTSNKFGEKNTNVVELYSHLEKNDQQRTYYNSGIGTLARPYKWSLAYGTQLVNSGLDLAIAWHCETNILDAYRWLSREYRDGDRIYLFGFSRGSYQVRVLSAMIDKVGLIHGGNEAQIPYAFELYASLTNSQSSTNPIEVAERTFDYLFRAASNAYYRVTKGYKPSPPANPVDQINKFKESFSNASAKVHFVGVWDTVSSVGIVRDKVLPGTADGMGHVCFFRHALALDERRVKFLPEYVNGGASKTESPSKLPLQTKEVWFAGTHCDVGGGEEYNPDLMDRGHPPLRWMMYEAREAGLLMNSASFSGKWDRNKLIKYNDSLTPPWYILEVLPVTRLTYNEKKKNETVRGLHMGRSRQIVRGQRIHNSIFLAETSELGLAYTPSALLPVKSTKTWTDLRQVWKSSNKGPTELARLLESDMGLLLEDDLLDLASNVVDRCKKKAGLGLGKDLGYLLSRPSGLSALQDIAGSPKEIYDAVLSLLQPPNKAPSESALTLRFTDGDVNLYAALLSVPVTSLEGVRFVGREDANVELATENNKTVLRVVDKALHQVGEPSPIADITQTSILPYPAESASIGKILESAVYFFGLAAKSSPPEAKPYLRDLLTVECRLPKSLSGSGPDLIKRNDDKNATYQYYHNIEVTQESVYKYIVKNDSYMDLYVAVYVLEWGDFTGEYHTDVIDMKIGSGETQEFNSGFFLDDGQLRDVTDFKVLISTAPVDFPRYLPSYSGPSSTSRRQIPSKILMDAQPANAGDDPVSMDILTVRVFQRSVSANPKSESATVKLERGS